MYILDGFKIQKLKTILEDGSGEINQKYYNLDQIPNGLTIKTVKLRNFSLFLSDFDKNFYE